MVAIVLTMDQAADADNYAVKIKTAGLEEDKATCEPVDVFTTSKGLSSQQRRRDRLITLTLWSEGYWHQNIIIGSSRGYLTGLAGCCRKRDTCRLRTIGKTVGESP